MAYQGVRRRAIPLILLEAVRTADRIPRHRSHRKRRRFGAPVARVGRGIEDWIGPSEVAARLKVSRATVYALVKSGALRHRRVGLQIRVPLSALDAFLAGSR
jgi:excisionase family DNA binding protein